MNCSLIVVSVSCIGIGAYGSASVWRLNVLSPGPSLRCCNSCMTKAGYAFTKNIVQYQEMIYFTHTFFDVIIHLKDSSASTQELVKTIWSSR